MQRLFSHSFLKGNIFTALTENVTFLRRRPTNISEASDVVKTENRLYTDDGAILRTTVQIFLFEYSAI